MRFKIYLTFFFKGRNNFTETYILHYTLPHITWSAFNERVNIAIMLLDVFTELVGGWLNNHNLDKNPSQLSNGKKRFFSWSTLQEFLFRANSPIQ